MLPKIPALIVILASLAAPLHAAAPDSEPDPVLINRLLNLRSQNKTPGVAIAMILEGSLTDGRFETQHARRVVTVHPVVEGGRQTRRAKTYDLQWTPEFGWFIWEIRGDDAGQTVWIWSERLGEQVIR